MAMLFSSACAVIDDRAARAVSDVPLYLEVGELNQLRISELERFVLAEYYGAETAEQALETIPRIVQVQLPFKPSLHGLHIAYGYLLDHLMIRQPDHPALAQSIEFYSELVRQHPNNDVVLYWAARAYDRRGLASNGLAARYYERAIKINNNNRWYLRDYIRGPNPPPPSAPQPFFRAESGKYRHLYPMYVRLVVLAATEKEAKHWKEEFRLLKACEGRICDFGTLAGQGTSADSSGRKDQSY